MNKKRSNLVTSLISLVITSFLLVFTIYSWYVSNEEVSASGIVGASEFDKATFTLQNWNVSANEWVNTPKLEKTNVLPGSTTYFRLKCVNNYDTTVKATAKFEGIESRLDTSFVKVSTDGKTITYNGIPTYEIANNKVTVDPVVENGDSKSVLYDIDGSNIYLRHFKIEEGYIIQRFGRTETTSGAVTKKDDVTPLLDTIDLSQSILNENTIAIGTSYYYFALTFLDNDDVDKYLMYQGLYIDSLTITRVS